MNIYRYIRTVLFREKRDALFLFSKSWSLFPHWRLILWSPQLSREDSLGLTIVGCVLVRRNVTLALSPKPVLVPWWTVAPLPGATVCTSHHWNICLMCLKRGVSGQTSAFLSTAFHYAKVIWNSGDSSGPSGSATFPIDLIHCWSQIEIHRMTPAPWNFQQRQINRDRKSPSGDGGGVRGSCEWASRPLQECDSVLKMASVIVIPPIEFLKHHWIS